MAGPSCLKALCLRDAPARHRGSYRRLKPPPPCVRACVRACVVWARALVWEGLNITDPLLSFRRGGMDGPMDRMEQTVGANFYKSRHPLHRGGMWGPSYGVQTRGPNYNKWCYFIICVQDRTSAGPPKISIFHSPTENVALSSRSGRSSRGMLWLTHSARQTRFRLGEATSPPLLPSSPLSLPSSSSPPPSKQVSAAAWKAARTSLLWDAQKCSFVVLSLSLLRRASVPKNHHQSSIGTYLLPLRFLSLLWFAVRRAAVKEQSSVGMTHHSF